MLKLFKWWFSTPKGIDNLSNFHRDLQYMIALGASHSLLNALAIVVTKQVLDGSDQLIALIHAAPMAGLLLTLIYTRLPLTNRVQSNYIYPHLVGWSVLIIGSMAGSAWLFASAVFLCSLLVHISSPLLGFLYRQMYKDTSRGEIVSSNRQWQTFAAMILAAAGGLVIEHFANAYILLYFAVSSFCFISALNFLKVDISDAHTINSRTRFKTYFNILKYDNNFSIFMLFQFLLGISNIAGIAALAVYITDERFLHLPPDQSAYIIGVLPTLAMFLSLRLWGKIFDRINIVHFRTICNLLIAIGFIVYPLMGMWGAIIGAIIWGMGRAGGQLAWTIGILAFAKPHRSRDYLTIHTFLTGVRGVIAPFIGVSLLNVMEPLTLLWVVAASIVISAVGTLTLVKQPSN